ncbi:HNH endonuclease [Azonexus sp. IMCC34842]|uniref:HNH endonuclease n=1 Tax=Azonexus sp. IMCC34842 TaxID=3420950 RepID=UPI003D11235F
MKSSIDNMFGFVPATQGERLFQLIAKQFISAEARNQVYQLEHLQIGRRQEDFAEYYLGVYCFNMMARLIRMAVHLVSDPSLDPKQQSKSMKCYLQTEWEIAIDRQNQDGINRLISLSLTAAETSKEIVNKSTKSIVTPEHQAIYCYICDKKLERATEDINTKVQYEHIWPRSFGGDSSPDNLLPACHDCNHSKGNTLLWQDAHLHSFVLTPFPDASDIKRIQYKERIALHRRNIFRRACDERITLKMAALKVGAMGEIKYRYPDDAIDFFNCNI